MIVRVFNSVAIQFLAMLCVSVVFASAGCGGATRPSGAVFTAEELMLFGNGADYAQDPDALGGQWKQQWERDQQARVEIADAVAIATVDSVSHDETGGEAPYIRLVLSVTSRLYGTMDEELTLRVEQVDPGYASIDGKQRALLEQSFVLALRWQRLSAESTEVEPRFHLTPATEPNVEFVQGSINASHGGGGGAGGRQTVVIHNNR